MQHGREFARLDRIIGGEATDTDAHVIQPARGVDPWPDRKPQVGGRKRCRRAARQLDQRPQARTSLPGAQAAQTRTDQRAVARIQGHEIRDGANRDQIKQLRKMGPLDQVLSMIPGVSGAMKGADLERGEQELRRTVAIIDSMTPRERADPSVMNGSRRKRIAKGSGTGVEDVNRLLKQFAQARKLMKGGASAMKRLAARV